jgi:hypothetical protein
MVSDDGEDGGDNGRYETWDEATDPSNGVTLHPASDATIKSLPIKKYAEVKTGDDENCAVCREKFEDEKLIMQLPCKHFFCQEECTAQWLKQHDNCPVCRAKVPAVEECSGNDVAHGDIDTTVPNMDAEQDEVEAAPERVAGTDRDDDVEMIDAW